MRTAILTDPLDFDGWRTAARAMDGKEGDAFEVDTMLGVET